MSNLTKQTAIDVMYDWLRILHPTAVPSIEILDHFKRVEQIDKQNSYNEGFAKAKSIYLDAE